METQQPLSIESFSYSWLLNLKPSLETLNTSFRASLDACDDASFIEIDPKMPPSKRFLVTSQFSFPVLQSPLAVVHAEELFSDGYVMPFCVDPSKNEAYDVFDPLSRLNAVASHTPNDNSGRKLRFSPLRRCRAFSKHVLCNYFRFLKPLYRRISCRRVGDVDSKLYRGETSPRISVAYSVDDCWRRSCDSDSSIYEAVLHCKKSIGI